MIWAIRLQTKELELQRLEVEETREELRRAADAQTMSQEMHFLSALLAARNNVAQGHAVAAEREQGPLRLNHVAHRQHLAELEWLLQQVDRHRSNPFALPAPSVLAAHQLGMVLGRAHQPLQLALANRATNHLRSLLLNLGEAIRELRRMLSADPQAELSLLLDRTHAQVESATTIDSFADMAQLCHEVYAALRAAAAAEFADAPPELKTQSGA